MLEVFSDSSSQSLDLVSTFSPSLDQNVFFSDTGNSTKLYTLLKPSETLSFVGTVAVTVLQGSISLFGSVIPASSTRHSIYAPKNYPLATMECIAHSNAPGMQSMVPDFMKNTVTASDAVLIIEDLCSGVQGLRQVCASHVAIFEAPNDFRFDFRLREFFPVCQPQVVLVFSDHDHRFDMEIHLIFHSPHIPPGLAL